MSQILELASVVIKNLPEDIDPSVAQGWIQNSKALKKALREVLCPPEIAVDLPIVPILKLVTRDIPVTGSTRFVAKDHFTRENGFYPWDNFKDHFLDKVEENISDTTLAIHRLEKPAVDAQIRKELGQKREEITLTHFFDLLKKQSKGENGHLLTNGYANIAYIRDKNGVLWVVFAFWLSVRLCWDVNARSVEHPDGWGDGRQVLSSDC